MAAFLNDLFNEASQIALESHTPDTGGAWAKHPNFTANGANVTTAGYVVGAAANGTAIYTNAATPASANYYVEAVIQLNTGIGDGYVGVIGRADTAASTFYQLFWLDGTGWVMQKLVAGVNTDLGTAYNADQPSTSVSVTARLEMNGSAIKGYINGTERFSVTDSAISAAGKAGVRTRGGGRLLSITADAVGAGGGAVPVGSSIPAQSLVVGIAYSFGLSSYFTNSPTSYALVSGTLPAGVTLNTSTGALSGTPTSAAGAVTLTFSATNANGTSTTNASGSFTVAASAASVDLSASPRRRLVSGTGAVRSSESVTLRFWRNDTGAHVVDKTVTTDAQGMCGVISDPAFSAGVTYDYRVRSNVDAQIGFDSVTAA